MTDILADFVKRDPTDQTGLIPEIDKQTDDAEDPYWRIPLFELMEKRLNDFKESIEKHQGVVQVISVSTLVIIALFCA